jgi:predicted XRE-type DNA-binding protein
MRHLEAGDLADIVDQAAGLLVGLHIARRPILGEIDLQVGNPDPPGVKRVLQRQLHAVGLALNAVEQHAGHRIKALGLTQTAAASRLGISQPGVSRLMKRRPTGFSTDRLLTLLTALDVEVDIVLRPAPEHAAKVSIREEEPT